MKLEIGLKSLGALCFFIFCFSFSWVMGIYDGVYLKSFRPIVLFLVPAFSVLIIEFFNFFWGLHRKSQNRLLLSRYRYDEGSREDLNFVNLNNLQISLGTNSNWNAFEFPLIFIKAFYFFSIVSIFFFFLNNRSFYLLSDFPQKLEIFSHKYCEDIEDKREEKKGDEKVGCDLVKRAYKLGYAKSLGDCEEKELDVSQMKVCKARRRDEPWLHYMGRKGRESLLSLKEVMNKDYVLKKSEYFKRQYKNIDLFKNHKEYALGAVPRSIHHVFTNLPRPKEGRIERLRESIGLNDCVERSQAQSLGASASQGKLNKSQIFEYVVNNLFFNPKIEPSVGYCRELKIHWNAQKQTCLNFKKEPIKTLTHYGILSETENLIKRRKNMVELHNFENETKSKGWKKRRKRQSSQLKIDRFMTFSCLSERKDISKDRISNYSFNFLGEKMWAREAKIPEIQTSEKGEIKLYESLANLFVKKFEYNQFKSKSIIDAKKSEEEMIEKFSDDDFLISKIEYLNSYDVFLGEDWLFDLVNVYPLHLHLGNYIKLFRTELKTKKERM